MGKGLGEFFRLPCVMHYWQGIMAWMQGNDLIGFKAMSLDWVADMALDVFWLD